MTDKSLEILDFESVSIITESIKLNQYLSRPTVSGRGSAPSKVLLCILTQKVHCLSSDLSVWLMFWGQVVIQGVTEVSD